MILVFGIFFQGKVTTPSVIYCGFCLQLAHRRIEETSDIIQLRFLVMRCL